MSFTASEEVIVAVNKNGSSGSCTGVIIQKEDDRLQVALRGAGLVLRHGSLIHLKSCGSPKVTAWGSVQHVGLAGDVKLVQVSSVRYEGQNNARAARCAIDLQISANYCDRDQNGKKTFGQTINISVSGVLARFKTTLSEGISVQMVLHLGAEKEVEAIARVVRIVQGTESASGGYEVGLEFERFIRGYEHLIRMAPPVAQP